MIITRNLNKIYKTSDIEVQALKEINISLDEGSIYSILGPSGSGKSTLLNCLSGIDKPTSGEIIIDDTDITKLNDNEITMFRSKNMRFVFQSYNLIPVLSAVENVELPLLINKVEEKKARKMALEMLSMVGLDHRCNSFPSMLSGGEAQRVGIARALVNRPKIVWADEPTGALDTKTSFEIMDLIVKLNKENNQTFIIVTHDPRITEFSQGILEMDSGNLTVKEMG